MKQSFAIAALVGVAMSRNLLGGIGGDSTNDTAFIQYLSTMNKHYNTTSELKLRKQIYQKNEKVIREQNNKADKNDPDALILGHNWTSDLTEKEYLNLLGLDQDLAELNSIDGLEMGKVQNSGNRRLSHSGKIDNTNGLGAHRATEVDWAADNKMGPVKDQGSCGSCWAFAATTALEGTIAIQSGNEPVRLSEQQIVDCTLTTNPKNEEQFGVDYGAYGCNGGWMSYAWNFMYDQGAMTDAEYPYESGYSTTEGECKHDASKTEAKVDFYGQIHSSIEDVKAKLREQPLAVAVDAGSAAFQFYKSGVVKQEDGCGTFLNHAVVLVGYTEKEDEVDPSPGPEPTPEPCNDEFKVNKWWHNEACDTKVSGRVQSKDSEGLSNYWKIQNSWGMYWGDEGFIRLEITEGEGVCGINKHIEFVNGRKTSM